jgi:hypothetical protein
MALTVIVFSFGAAFLVLSATFKPSAPLKQACEIFRE